LELHRVTYFGKQQFDDGQQEAVALPDRHEFHWDHIEQNSDNLTPSSDQFGAAETHSSCLIYFGSKVQNVLKPSR
jgi:hypothetical protein